MNNKKYNVHLILEGDEEECFFNIVKKFGVHNCIELTFKNAGGFGNVGPFYQNEIINEEHDCNLCVYDVDYRQKEDESPYNHIQEELLLIMGDKNCVDAVSYCTNPNILQFLLLGCDCIDKVKLLSGSKKTNTSIIHKYWNGIGRNIQNRLGQEVINYYDANHWQLKMISDSYEYGEYSYETLYANSKSLSKDFLTFEPGSNIFELLEALKEGNIDYFSKINDLIDNCE